MATNSQPRPSARPRKPTGRKAADRKSPPAKRASAASKAAAQKAPADWSPAVRTAFLIDAFGGARKLAGALGVSSSQPTRWKSGHERPGLEAARKLLDLDHVLARAQLVWEPEAALIWLESPNAFLDGARPIDVLLLRGSSEVLDALDATMAGAFA